MPEDVLKQTTPATELLEKKKELADVEDALEQIAGQGVHDMVWRADRSALSA